MINSRVRVLVTAMTLALVSDFAMAAVLTVNSTADDTNAGDGFVTLREAIIAANGDGSTDLGQTAAGADTLDLSAVSGTITLHDSLPWIVTPIRIEGSHANPVTVSGDDGVARHRLFLVGGGSLDIDSVDLADGLARGGGGATCEQRTGCGGGGAGLGGIVFLDAGSVSLTHVTLSNGSAVGGSGGSRDQFSPYNTGGGGGGGMTLSAVAPVIGGGGSPGADGAPLSGLGGTAANATDPAGTGGDGAGGGGGGRWQQIVPGGHGGFAGGGGGGGSGLIAGVPGSGGTGGFGAGGGGSGGQSGASAEGVGGAGGPFGGNGANSSDAGNVAGGGGGGAGLGGALFARSGSVRLDGVTFIGCAATRGAGGNNSGTLGGNGQGKASALFLADGVVAQARGLTFTGGSADDASGNGYTAGASSDTIDVYGIIEQLPAAVVDLAVTTAPAYSGEYARVPSGFGIPATFAATLSNPGDEALTNAIGSATAKLDGAATAASVAADPIASIAEGDSAEAAFGGGLDFIGDGAWSVEYRFSVSETETDLANNVVEVAGPLIGGDELARHEGAPVSTLGIGAHNGGEIGVAFTLAADGTFRGARFGVAPVPPDNGADPPVPNPCPGFDYVLNLRVFDSVAGEPGALIDTTVPVPCNYNEGGVYDVEFVNGPQSLAAGTYVLSAVEPVGGQTLPLFMHEQRYTPGTGWVNWPTTPLEGWGNVEEFGAGFARTPELSLLLAPPELPIFQDGFELVPPQQIRRSPVPAIVQGRPTRAVAPTQFATPR